MQLPATYQDTIDLDKISLHSGASDQAIDLHNLGNEFDLTDLPAPQHFVDNTDNIDLDNFDEADSGEETFTERYQSNSTYQLQTSDASGIDANYACLASLTNAHVVDTIGSSVALGKDALPAQGTHAKTRLHQSIQRVAFSRLQGKKGSASPSNYWVAVGLTWRCMSEVQSFGLAQIVSDVKQRKLPWLSFVHTFDATSHNMLFPK